ncbi:DUF47 domain-containing protein [Bifidobacterium leontopitheci]|uniref:Phosphate transport regulator n=1 Tax=Bifidobacterium leontopitheci TaxID=2650774 RepID=A0A6I1GHU8_9BIFI|nr:DUF47 family protein [Bifidobacterium leontopitheci]KAB7791215.1 hypothetical protein F7D09_0168 [Bifidobacterium leontopitheci]
MARKNDSFYFDGFRRSADYACQAAHLLSDVMHQYDPARLRDHMEAMHRIEQSADEVRHGIMDELVTAFITPFDRDDIARLSSALDDITDHIEGALHRMYYDNVLQARPDAIELTDVVVHACEQIRDLTDELPRFKRSKTLRERVFSVNKSEQDADQLFVEAMRTLHTTCDDPMQVIGWHEVYEQLERCADDCEHVADVIDGIVMENS